MPEVATDPVCDMQVGKDKAAAKFEYKGRMYYFCAVACKDEFERNPEKYLAGSKEATEGTPRETP